MSELRPIECVQTEDRLLEGTPAEAAALLREAGPGDHLALCAACARLAADVAALASLREVEPPPQVVEAALSRAGAELRALQREARRSARWAALQVAAVAVVCLPLSVAWMAAILRGGALLLAPLLPAALTSYMGLLFFSFSLAALSALAFILTLLAGAAARPPRLLEV